MLVKHYGPPPEGAQRRYSPAECVGTTVGTVTGNPDRKHISTSYAERANLPMRMGIRRFTRLTNAFSKKVENHIYALAIYFMHYNYVRIHSSLRVTPAMAAGVLFRLRSIFGCLGLFRPLMRRATIRELKWARTVRQPPA
jgi:hypothetical protein